MKILKPAPVVPPFIDKITCIGCGARLEVEESDLYVNPNPISTTAKCASCGVVMPMTVPRAVVDRVLRKQLQGDDIVHGAGR